MTRYAGRFGRVARSLSRVELMRSSMDETFPADVRELMDADAGRRWLDYYGDEGLELAFERYGLTSALERRGWIEPQVSTVAMDDRHTLFVDARSGELEARLLELVVRRDRLVVEGLDAAFEVLTVDWLLLQNPKGEFSEKRLRLPGQDYPGLGIGERVLEMLYITVDRLHLDGLVTTAEHFHNAVLYGREMKYVDPRYEGQLKALEDLLLDREDLSLAEASWAMEWGYVLDVDDSVVRWRGEAMVRAKEPTLTAYVTSREHAKQSDHHAENLRYRLHRAAFEEHWEREREALLTPPASLHPPAESEP